MPFVDSVPFVELGGGGGGDSQTVPPVVIVVPVFDQIIEGKNDYYAWHVLIGILFVMHLGTK